MPFHPRMVMDRTFPGETKIAEFNANYHAHLEVEGARTLADLVTQVLGHPPAVGDVVRIGRFKLTVEEAALRGAKTIAVRTIF